MSDPVIRKMDYYKAREGREHVFTLVLYGEQRRVGYADPRALTLVWVSLQGRWALNQIVINPVNLAILRDTTMLQKIASILEATEDNIARFEQEIQRAGFTYIQ